MVRENSTFRNTKRENLTTPMPQANNITNQVTSLYSGFSFGFPNLRSAYLLKYKIMAKTAHKS